jgi:hypothetical protein
MEFMGNPWAGIASHSATAQDAPERFGVPPQPGQEFSAQ